jgi:hypothetical protein
LIIAAKGTTVGGYAQRRSERASSPLAKSHLPQSLRFAAECFVRFHEAPKTFGRKAASYEYNRRLT